MATEQNMETCEEENEEVVNGVNNLPNEILAKLFSYLSVKDLISSTRIVCRRWFHVSYDSNLWTTLTTNDVKELKQYSVSHLVHRLFCSDDLFYTLKYLSLDRSDITHNDLSMLPYLVPNLRQLSLPFCSQVVDKSVLELFSNVCDGIEILNLEDCKIMDDCLVLFCNHKITSLNLSHCNLLTDTSLYLISEWNIRDLNIDGVQWITDEAVVHLLQNCKHSLEHLWLDGDNLTDEGLKMLRHCHNMRDLKVSYCEELTDVTLSNISEMTSLTSLSLRKGKNFTNEGLIILFQNLQKGLYSLDFYDSQGFTDEVVHWLTQSSPHLIELDLSWNWSITDEGLEYIISRCRNMQNLILIGLHELTGKPLKDTADRLPRLKFLDLTNCNAIIDDILDDIARQIVSLSIVDYYGNVV